MKGRITEFSHKSFMVTMEQGAQGFYFIQVLLVLWQLNVQNKFTVWTLLEKINLSKLCKIHSCEAHLRHKTLTVSEKYDFPPSFPSLCNLAILNDWGFFFRSSFHGCPPSIELRDHYRFIQIIGLGLEMCSYTQENAIKFGSERDLNGIFSFFYGTEKKKFSQRRNFYFSGVIN